MKAIKGKVCKDKLTKVLVQKIQKNNIAVIRHRAIDLVAAQDLKYKNVRAVINCERSIDESCSIDGLKYLIDNDIQVYEVYDKDFFNMIHDGDFICLYNNQLFVNNIFYTYYHNVTNCNINEALQKRSVNDMDKRIQFVKNTMDYMNYELDYFLGDRELPELDTKIKDRDVIVVSRGRGYRDDLKSIKRFIINRKPVIISVDGGADAVTDMGLWNDIIIGDMDSVSDRSLINCCEILVHTYSNGYAPGLKRIKSKGLSYKSIQLKGTSEDAALYMAKLKGASNIYFIGSHTSIEEFFEKSRPGMGSTVLLRILMGANIIDLKGIRSITAYNRINYQKASVIVLIALLLAGVLFSYNDIAYYIQTSLKALFYIN